MKLKIGDILEFEGSNYHNAKKGAKAIFKGYTTSSVHDGEEYITVEWIRDGLSDEQMDGNYYEYLFTKVEENEKVMKIDFEKGKQRIIERLESFTKDFESDMMQDIKSIASGDKQDKTEEISYVVKSIQDNAKLNSRAINKLQAASSMLEVFEALEGTILEENDGFALGAFLGVDSVTIA